MAVVCAFCFNDAMRSLLIVCALASTLHAAPPAESLLEHVPDGSVAAMVVRKGALTWARAFFDSSPAMREELATYLLRTLGVDLTRIEGAVGYTSRLGGPDGFAVLLRIASPGALQLPVVGSHAGTDLMKMGKLVAAAVPAGILVGSEGEVRAGIDVARKQAPALSARSPLAALLTVDRGADVLIGLLPGSAGDRQLVAMAQGFGVRAVTVVLTGSGRIIAEATGDPALLDKARLLLGNVALMTVQKLKDAKDVATQGKDVMAGAAAIASYHQSLAFWKEFQPRMAGNKLIGQYQLPELKSAATFLPLVGILSAVAIPAFIKYTRRSKSAEATLHLRALRASLQAHRIERKNPKQLTFPPSTGWTPATGCCGNANDTCAPGGFDAPGWRALQFTISEPHRYQYRLTSEGRGQKARYTIEARGDLDCNGKFSSFKMTGDATSDGELESRDETE
jgi:type II secretory pathway pseudopilin PulG